MKNLYSILVLFLAVNFLNAQAEFPVLDARWCYHGYGDTGEDLGNFCVSPIELVETNGKTYTKVAFHKHPNNNATEELLYREENRKFYVIPENETEEILIYDFNLIVGDTFVTSYGWGGNDTITLYVQSVDTVVTTDGVSRKKIILENNDTGKYGTWLEGIGSLDWIFVYPTYVASVSGYYIFTCHSKGTETIYPDSPGLNCNLIIKTDDLKEDLSFEIFPNPVEEVINIDFKKIRASKLTIVSLTGNVVVEKKINLEQKTLKISTNLKAGLYFVKVSTKEGIVMTKKFVKI